MTDIAHPTDIVPPQDAFAFLRATMDPRRTSAEQVADVLRESISNGTLTPGTRLQEETLTANLGVARNTLRESFRSLVHERLLVHEINRGVFVTIPSPDDVQDVYRLRKLLECGALRNVAPGADLTELDAAIAEAQVAVDTNDWVGAGTANIRFHRAVVGLTGSTRQIATMRTLLAETRLHVSAFDPRAWHSPFAPRNAEVVDALHSGSSERAANLMGEMLDDACDAIAGAITSLSGEDSS